MMEYFVKCNGYITLKTSEVAKNANVMLSIYQHFFCYAVEL